MASAPLLEFAIPLAEGELQEYYIHHREEELGHDEMLKDDLRKLGVIAIPEYFCAAEIAGSQYYLIAHKHPAMLLGYMVSLESNPMAEGMVLELETHHGVALTAMRHHSVHDPRHFEDLCEIINTLPDGLQHDIAWNIHCTSLALKNAIDALRTH